VNFVSIMYVKLDLGTLHTHILLPTGLHTWLTPYCWQISSVLSSGVGLLPLAITKMFLAGKILSAAASVGPMSWAALYYIAHSSACDSRIPLLDLDMAVLKRRPARPRDVRPGDTHARYQKCCALNVLVWRGFSSRGLIRHWGFLLEQDQEWCIRVAVKC
jgi:hypothetical protein